MTVSLMTTVTARGAELSAIDPRMIAQPESSGVETNDQGSATQVEATPESTNSDVQPNPSADGGTSAAVAPSGSAQD